MKRQWMIAGLVWAALVGMMTLNACTHTREAYGLAKGHPDKVVFVTSELYYAWQKEANRLADEGKLQGDQLAKVKALDKAAAPKVIKALEVAKKYRDAVAAVEGVSLAETEAELKEAYLEAADAVADFVQLLKEVAQNGS